METINHVKEHIVKMQNEVIPLQQIQGNLRCYVEDVILDSCHNLYIKVVTVPVTCH